MTTSRPAVRRAAPLLVAATVLVVLLGGGWALNRTSAGDADGGSGAGNPPVLRLAGYQPRAATGTADERWHLAGTLPAGQLEAAVRSFEPASPEQVDALARSLGLTGKGRVRDGATAFTGDTGTLRVAAGEGGQWDFALGGTVAGTPRCPPHPTESVPKDYPDVHLACDLPATVAATPGASSHEGALTLARPVLDAAGADPDTARVTGPSGGPEVIVVADPRPGDRPSYGMPTSVTIVGTSIASAAGWLGDTHDGATYPLISAREAWRRLARTPMPQTLAACPQPRPEGVDPLACGGPVTVTGAELGVSLQREGSAPRLVPTWLFAVRDSAQPVPVVAVDPAYLAAEPGATDGGPPEPASPGSRFQAVLPTESDDALVVTFTGGVDSCYDYRVLAQETASQVRLSLVEKRVPGTTVCIDLAQIYQRTVPLTQPLGDRAVVDAESGAAVKRASP
jgi:hypothetical protein